MTHLLKTSAAVLAILALGMAQLFGVCQGYLCLCGNEPLAATTSECGPSDLHTECQSSCWHDEAPAPEAPPSHDCPGHVPSTDALKAQSHCTPLSAPAPLLVELPGPPACFFPCCLAEVNDHLRVLPDLVRGSPPTPLLVVRCVVRMV